MKTRFTLFVASVALSLPLSPAIAGVLDLDGIDSWVDFTNPNALIPTGDSSFTIEAWINPTTIPAGGASGGQITFWGQQATNEANGFRMASGEGVNHYFWGNDFQINPAPEGDMLDDATGPGSDGWHHLAISYDGTTNTSTWFQNGSAIGTTVRPNDPSVADANFRIGARADGAEDFHGQIDELRIWDVARAEADIANTFDKEIATDSGGLVAYFKFDGAVPDFSDSTGNGHDGAASGLASTDDARNAPVVPELDSDGDGLPDAWEEMWFGDDNLGEGPDGDPDNDGLTNLEEFNFSISLDPSEADTDGDGLDDGPEVETHMTNPLSNDSDGDTLTDGEEVNTHMTDPNDADSDNDTIDDATEIANGTDPNDQNDPPSTAGNGALCLDGTSFVTFSNAAGLIPSGDEPFTIESWINPTTIPTGGANGGQITFWGTQGPVNTSNGFRLRGSTGVRHYFWGNDHDENFTDEGGGQVDVLDDATGPNEDGWHHLAVTYDGAETQWYWNGSTLGLPRAVSGLMVADQNHRIGSRIGAEFFDGWIDELRIWDVARSAQEIADSFETSLSPDESGLVAYWDFTGNMADITGNGHDGTPMGNALVSGLFNAPVGSSTPLAITGIDFDAGTRTAKVTWASRAGRTYAIDFNGDLIGEWEEIDDGQVATSESSSFDDIVPEGVTRRHYRVRDVTP